MWVLFQRVWGFCAVKGDISFVCDLSIQADSLKKKSPIFMKTKAKKPHYIVHETSILLTYTAWRETVRPEKMYYLLNFSFKKI